jgi:ankyrin repeat protein
MIAVSSADERAIELMIELGANVNQRDARGRMPLDIASDHKNARKMALLEQRGAKRSGIPKGPPRNPMSDVLSPFVGGH